jgi:pyrroloquinoline quinone biosynthesis protein B
VSRLCALVLGAAAGGGLPQWNCACRNCTLAREGKIPVQTQSSLAASADGVDWALLNASPDIRAQLTANSQMWPRSLRSSPVKCVVLTNGDIDHIGGLLTLREKQPFKLFLTQSLNDILSANPVFAALDSALVGRVICEPGSWIEVLPGLSARLFPVPGKAPLYLESGTVDTEMMGGQTVGAEIKTGEARLVYIPGCSKMTDEIKSVIDGADALFFDGTLFRDDEMVTEGLGSKMGLRMGHMPISGPGGSLEMLAGVAAKRKIYVHMNNTNPIWRPGSGERQAVESAGVEIGFDGMELLL